jgi:ribose transport system substrate-binding protein
MRYKQTYGLVAAVGATALLAAGCGSSASSGTSANGGSAAKKKVAMVLANKADPFFLTIRCGAQQEARKLGVGLTVQLTNDYSPGQQIAAINSATATQPQAVVVDPMDPQAIFPPLQQAHGNGAKLVTLDGTLNDKSLLASEIVSDDYHAGVVSAQQLAGLIGGKGKVLMIALQTGVPPVQNRINGFKAGMKAYPNITVLPIQYDNSDPQRAATILSATLARNPDLAGIYSENPPAVQGATNALKQAGKVGKVKQVVFDGSPTTVADLRSGAAQAIVVQEPRLEGQIAVRQAIAAIDGKPTPKHIVTPVQVITTKNLSTPQAQQTLWKAGC